MDLAAEVDVAVKVRRYATVLKIAAPVVSRSHCSLSKENKSLARTKWRTISPSSSARAPTSHGFSSKSQLYRTELIKYLSIEC